MANQEERLGIVVYVEDQATGKLAKVKAEVKGLGTTTSSSSMGVAAGVAKVEKSTSRLGTALSHAKSQIGGLLTGPLGFLGLSAGLLTIGGSFAAGLGKAQEWGLQIEKLQGITHDTAESLSGLLAVTEKYGLANERLAQIAGFSEKALGAMTKGSNDNSKATTALTKAHQAVIVAEMRLAEMRAKGKASASSLTAAEFRLADARTALTKAQATATAGTDTASKFLADYGFSILDAKGKVKDFASLLLTFADYWKNGSELPSQKAAAAAKLFGRGYADLVPVLNLGTQGIKDAEEEAKNLGLTLTQDNIVALAKAREATRQWGDALGGLELQLGLTLLPVLTDVSQAATKFVGDNREQIIGFFREGAHFAEQLGGAIHDDVLPVFGAIASAWGAIPDPLKELLIGGFVAQKAIKWTFGVDILKPIMGSLTGSGGLFSRGSPTNPMWVATAGGGLPGAPGGSAGGGIMNAVMKVALVAMAADVAVQLAGALGAQSTQIQQQGADLVAQANAANDPAAIQATLNYMRDQEKDFGTALTMVLTNPLNHGMDNWDATKKALEAQLASLTRPIGEHAAQLATSLDNLNQSAGKTADDLAQGSAAFLAKIKAEAFQFNLGEKANAATLLKGIAERSQAKYGHAASQGAIDNTFTRDLLHTTGLIVGSSKSVESKIEALKVLQATAAGHSATASAAIKRAIDDEKAVLRAKRLAVTVNTKPTSNLQMELAFYGSTGTVTKSISQSYTDAASAKFGPGYATGAIRTREGPAYLHDDEMVVPKGPAEALRRTFGSQGSAGGFDHVAAAATGGGFDGAIRAQTRELVAAMHETMTRVAITPAAVARSSAQQARVGAATGSSGGGGWSRGES